MENVKIIYDDEKKCADCPMRYICDIATKGKCPYEAKFKIGDRVIPSKLMSEKCEVSDWFERVKAKVEEDGYLVIRQIYGTGTYLVEGLSSIVFIDEWLEPYSPDIEQGPLTLLTEDGLSVRDRFAMAALMCFRADLFTAPEYVAEKAYKVADAMMEVRKI